MPCACSAACHWPSDPFLTAAVKERIDRYAVSNPEPTDALGAVDLVCRDGDHITGIKRHRHTPEALDGVAEDERAVPAGDGGHVGDRLNDADLVVDEHRGDEAGPTVDPIREEIEINETVGPDGEDVSLESLPAEPFHRIEHAGMFGGKRDNLAPRVGQPRRRALQRPVGRFRSAGGEEELSRGPFVPG